MAKLNSIPISIFGILFMLFAVGNAWAEQLLDTVSKNLSGVTSAKSSFREEKHMAMLKKPIVTEGFFIFASPNSLRWEYTKPYSSGFTLNKSGGTSWDTSLDMKRKFTTQSDPLTSAIAKQLIMWTTFDKTAIESQYSIKQTAPFVLELTPLSKGTRDVISKISIGFTQDAASVEYVEVHEKGGDYMRTVFYDKVFNAAYAPTLFE